MLSYSKIPRASLTLYCQSKFINQYVLPMFNRKCVSSISIHSIEKNPKQSHFLCISILKEGPRRRPRRKIENRIKCYKQEVKCRKKNGCAIYMKAISGQFLAFRNILEKSLLEEMCLELKTAWKNVLKNVQEAFLLIPKIF